MIFIFQFVVIQRYSDYRVGPYGPTLFLLICLVMNREISRSLLCIFIMRVLAYGFLPNPQTPFSVGSYSNIPKG